MPPRNIPRSSPAEWSSARRSPVRSSLEPKLLFLDEPTSGLDPISAADFDALLLYLHGELKLTVVMITHDLDSLFRTCDRVGVIVDGRMVSDTLPGILENTSHGYTSISTARGRAARNWRRRGRSCGADR